MQTLLKEQLEILLPTYNRKKHLLRTLTQLTAPESPVRSCSLTVLDNASTDGSSELIEEFAAKIPTIKHIRHAKNIGGNANIARAFEMARAEYVWVLCDDDAYDFSHWDECQAALDKHPAAVVVANYAAPQRDTAALFKQLSFVPAAIYRTDLITDDVLMNIYFNISNLFPHLAVAAAALNSGQPMPVLEHALVTMQLNSGNDSYVRGVSQRPHRLMKEMFWSLGYLRSLPLLADRCQRVACAFRAQTEEECFYNFCGRFMEHGKNPFYLFLRPCICGKDLLLGLFRAGVARVDYFVL